MGLFKRFQKWIGLAAFYEDQARRREEAARLIAEADAEMNAMKAEWLDWYVHIKRGTHYQLDGACGIVRSVERNAEGKFIIGVGFQQGILNFGPDNLEKWKHMKDA